MTDKYNINKIVRIKVKDFAPSRWHVWKDEIKLFGLVTRKAGVYNDVTDNYVCAEIPKDWECVLKDGQIVNKPQVVIYFQSGIEKTVSFETLAAAEMYSNSLELARTSSSPDYPSGWLIFN
jgi:hypothetical protein